MCELLLITNQSSQRKRNKILGVWSVKGCIMVGPEMKWPPTQCNISLLIVYNE